ncbi:MAG: hypothetical protein ACE5EC_07920 [Phycisphaerae bacterium]
MTRGNKHHRLLKLYGLSRRKGVWLSVAALPLFQTGGCLPDPIGALNFELQSMINSALINAVNIVVQNLLGL